MSIVLQVVLIVGTVAFLLAVLRSVRHGHLDLKYSLLWLLLGVLLLLCAIFPGIVVFFTGLLGIGLPSNFVFMAGLLCTLVICMSLTRIVSGQDRKIRSLIQHVSLLEKRLADADRAAGLRPAAGLLPEAAEPVAAAEPEAAAEPAAYEDGAPAAEPERGRSWANEELTWGVSAPTAAPAVSGEPEVQAPLSGVATTGSWEALPQVDEPAADAEPTPAADPEPDASSSLPPFLRKQ